ncbi:MAG: CoA transferase [Proteobacteria bacterium]|nr:CoA transferase [Pseudomonadota bacterium]
MANKGYGQRTVAGPLAGYRVIELTSTVSGPLAGMILADQGADVVKVEPPGTGDLARFMGNNRNGVAAQFSVLNRNKRSIALDLKQADDAAILRRLVETADVLIENYRPGVTAKLGVDYESLAAVNPRLVYGSITGYGQSGPYVHRRVYDPLVQATIGMAGAQGGGDRPANVRTVLFDKVSGMTAAQAVTAALLQRERTGRGQFLPVSMMDAGLYFLWPDAMWQHTLLGDEINEQGALADYFPLFATSDGHVSTILIVDSDFAALCEALGCQLHADPRFANFGGRVANRQQLAEEMDAVLADRDTESLCRLLDELDVPSARVNPVNRVHEDPQVRHGNTLVEAEHPEGGSCRLPRPPLAFDGQEPGLGSASPVLGEHARELMAEAGLPEAEIERLEERDRANRGIFPKSIDLANLR